MCFRVFREDMNCTEFISRMYFMTCPGCSKYRLVISISKYFISAVCTSNRLAFCQFFASDKSLTEMSKSFAIIASQEIKYRAILKKIEVQVSRYLKTRTCIIM